MSNKFDVIAEGVSRLASSASATKDRIDEARRRKDLEDFKLEHESRQLIATKNIDTRNKLLAQKIYRELQFDVNEKTNETDWSNNASVAKTRERVFGEEGILASAQAKFESEYVQIPDVPNETFHQNIIGFDRVKRAAADHFVKRETEEASAANAQELTQNLTAIGAKAYQAILNEEDPTQVWLEADSETDTAIEFHNVVTTLKVASTDPITGKDVFIQTQENYDSTGAKAESLELIVDTLIGDNRSDEAVDLLRVLRGNPNAKSFEELHPNLKPEQLAHVELIRKVAQEEGVDPNLLLAMAWQESALDPNAKSDAGAIGLLQLMPKTAAEILGLDFLPKEAGDITLEQNVRGGAIYIRTQLEKYGDLAPALSAYNAGPTATDKAIAKGQEYQDKFYETRGYVERIIPAYEAMGGATAPDGLSQGHFANVLNFRREENGEAEGLTVYQGLMSKLVTQNQENLERLPDSVSQAAADISSIQSEIDDIEVVVSTGRPLNEEANIRLESLNKELEIIVEQINNEIEASFDLAESLGVSKPYQRTQMQSRLASEIEYGPTASGGRTARAGGGSGAGAVALQTGTGPAAGLGSSLMERVATIQKFSNANDLEATLDAISLYTKDQDSPGLNSSDMIQALTLMKTLHGEGRVIEAESIFENLQRGDANNPYFWSKKDSGDNARFRSALRTSRSFDEFRMKFEAMDSQAVTDFELDPAYAFYRERQRDGDLVPNTASNNAKVIIGARSERTARQGGFILGETATTPDVRSVEHLARMIAYQNPNQSHNASLEQAINRSSNSQVFGYVAGSNLPSEVVDGMAMSALMAKGYFEDITSFDQLMTAGNLSLKPIPTGSDKPFDQSYQLVNNKTERPLVIDGELVIIDFSAAYDEKGRIKLPYQSPEVFYNAVQNESITEGFLGDPNQAGALAISGYTGGYQEDGFIKSSVDWFNTHAYGRRAYQDIGRSHSFGSQTPSLLERIMYGDRPTPNISSEAAERMQSGDLLGTPVEDMPGYNAFSVSLGQAVLNPTTALTDDVKRILGDEGLEELARIQKLYKLSMAQGNPRNPEEALAEQIYSFAVEMAVRQDGDINLPEYFSGGAQHAEDYLATLTEDQRITLLRNFDVQKYDDFTFVDSNYSTPSVYDVSGEVLDDFQSRAAASQTGLLFSDLSDAWAKTFAERDAVLDNAERGNSEDQLQLPETVEPETRQPDQSMLNLRMQDVVVKTEELFTSDSITQLITEARQSEGFNPNIIYFKKSDVDFNDFEFTKGVMRKLADSQVNNEPVCLDIRDNGQNVSCHVSYIHDGDTVFLSPGISLSGSVVSEGNKPSDSYSIRFANVAAPEVANPYKGTPDEPGGLEAREFVVEAFNGQDVLFIPLLHTDGTVRKGDFDRDIKYPVTPDMGDVTLAQVTAGKVAFRGGETVIDPENIDRSLTMQAANEQAKALGIGIYRGDVTHAKFVNERFFMRFHGSVLAEGKELVNEDGETVTMEIASVTPIPGASDTWLIPLYNPEEKRVYSLDQAEEVWEQFYKPLAMQGEILPYKDVKTAEYHKRRFHPQIVGENRRSMQMRSFIGSYHQRSERFDVDGTVKEWEKATRSWTDDETSYVLQTIQSAYPHKIPTLQLLKATYEAYFK